MLAQVIRGELREKYKHARYKNRYRKGKESSNFFEPQTLKAHLLYTLFQIILK